VWVTSLQSYGMLSWRMVPSVTFQRMHAILAVTQSEQIGDKDIEKANAILIAAAPRLFDIC